MTLGAKVVPTASLQSGLDRLIDQLPCLGKNPRFGVWCVPGALCAICSMRKKLRAEYEAVRFNIDDWLSSLQHIVDRLGGGPAVSLGAEAIRLVDTMEAQRDLAVTTLQAISKLHHAGDVECARKHEGPCPFDTVDEVLGRVGVLEIDFEQCEMCHAAEAKTRDEEDGVPLCYACALKLVCQERDEAEKRVKELEDSRCQAP